MPREKGKSWMPPYLRKKLAEKRKEKEGSSLRLQ